MRTHHSHSIHSHMMLWLYSVCRAIVLDWRNIKFQTKLHNIPLFRLTSACSLSWVVWYVPMFPSFWIVSPFESYPHSNFPVWFSLQIKNNTAFCFSFVRSIICRFNFQNIWFRNINFNPDLMDTHLLWAHRKYKFHNCLNDSFD